MHKEISWEYYIDDNVSATTGMFYLYRNPKYEDENGYKYFGFSTYPEYARHKETWYNYKDMLYELSEAFYYDLRDISEIKNEARQAKKERKFNNDIDSGVEIFNLGYKYWINVYKKVENERVLSFGDIMFIKSMADIIHRNGLPTSAQTKRLIRLYNAAEDAGIVFE